MLPTISHLPLESYDLILTIISKYDLRERRQRRLRIGHFWVQTGISIASFIAVWWSPRNFVAFILLLVNTLGFGAGVVDGLMGFLFVGSELRALREFEYEIKTARAQASGKSPATQK